MKTELYTDLALILCTSKGKPFIAPAPPGRSGPHWLLFSCPEALLKWAETFGVTILNVAKLTPALLEQARQSGVGLVADPGSADCVVDLERTEFLPIGGSA